MQASQNFELVVKRARDFAQQFQHTRVSPLHLLLALLRTPECQGYKHLENQQVPLEKLSDYISHNRLNLEPYGKPSGELNSRSKLVLNQSAQTARQMGSTYTRTEHLLLGLLAEPVLGRDVYPVVGVSHEKLAGLILAQYGLQPEMCCTASRPGPEHELEQIAVNLTELAKQGKLDPVIGRTNEIRRTMQILGRRRKNNPILVGDAGVGKTAIIEGVALSIANQTCPPHLLNWEIFVCDVTSLVSNSIYRGQLEGRFKALLDYVRDNPHIILFIDEIHLIVGAGTSMGGLDIANMMKVALSRGEMRVVGATTKDGYGKSIEKDPALERRFQPVPVDEPNDDEVLAILQGCLPAYEAHHMVQYDPGAILSALQLSKRYIPNRRMPDKALDVLDEAGAAVRMVPPPDLQALAEEIAEHTLNTSTTDQVPAEELDCRLRQLQDRRLALLKRPAELRQVTEEDVRAAISRISRIPAEMLNAGAKRAALQLEGELGREVVGQRHVVGTLARYLRRVRTRLNDPGKPLGTLLLLGPTGVGKTLLAKRAAVHLTGSPEGLITLDMSEYMERQSVARLIGAPPGYKGYEDQTTLVEKVRRQPYAVVLFDEIEKAHPLVWNVLLQILEEGRLTDGQGRVANFCQTLVLLTSNVGYEHFHRKNIGFQPSPNAPKEAVLESAKREFRPEFLNRLDEMLVFDPLTRDDCRQILALEVENIRQRTGFAVLELSASLQEQILCEGFSEEYGARPLKRTLERLLTDPISDALLQDKIRDSGTLHATYNEIEGTVLRSAGATAGCLEQAQAVLGSC